jgi:hypothetical protein
MLQPDSSPIEVACPATESVPHSPRPHAPVTPPNHSQIQCCKAPDNPPDPQVQSPPSARSHRTQPVATAHSPRRYRPEKCRGPHRVRTRSRSDNSRSRPAQFRHPGSPAHVLAICLGARARSLQNPNFPAYPVIRPVRKRCNAVCVHNLSHRPPASSITHHNAGIQRRHVLRIEIQRSRTDDCARAPSVCAPTNSVTNSESDSAVRTSASEICVT